MNLKNSQWITTARDLGDVCPVFCKRFCAEKKILSATLEITALGVYEAELNGKRVGDFVLAPGWTSYDHRLQVQTYDVTELLREENELRVTVGRGWFRSPMPGWLYSVTRGATTIWEHWDGAKEDGSFWSADMNSFNHYAYGAVADWVFEKAAGIRHEENATGFAELTYEPHPDPRVGFLNARLETRHGTIRASWRYEENGIRYELETPVPVTVRLDHTQRQLAAGSYTFWTATK